DQALNKVFDIQSPYGIKNNQMIRDLGIVDRKNLTQARRHLKDLMKRGGFWNRRLRAEAGRVVEKWDAR
ncbi:hypothetical protein ACFLR7_07170, partial [Acidobacteriota bacterium]